ncbi:MAG: DUF6464 family protein [Oscillatoriaceae bacterium SKW80]|nr:DUF6464 family protein [Oscillatoriaceae bacterium SKYG93]MCX8121374.1 DUF6464 family protein [Oscillatoriaceae bacterium SKW80]MDW8451949.1 DUF6464 family protein [Oscillatoriaceae cyanobacterium SKYGB_i_bin93]
MLEIIVIFLLGLMPPIISILTRRQTETRVRARLIRAMETATYPSIQRLPPSLNQYDPEEFSLPIGAQTCRFNARSPFIRCAVNPLGPCQGCSHYQRRD